MSRGFAKRQKYRSKNKFHFHNSKSACTHEVTDKYKNPHQKMVSILILRIFYQPLLYLFIIRYPFRKTIRIKQHCTDSKKPLQQNQKKTFHFSFPETRQSHTKVLFLAFWFIGSFLCKATLSIGMLFSYFYTTVSETDASISKCGNKSDIQRHPPQLA